MCFKFNSGLQNLHEDKEMSKKSRNRRQKISLDFDDEDYEFYDDDLDMDELARDIHSTDWGDYDYEKSSKADSRRRIERQRDMKKLYSELDEWEEFGVQGDW